VQRAEARRCRTQHVAREPPVPRPRFDHHERIGCAEVAPTPVERAPDAGAEQRADFGTGDEVAARAPRAPTRREEADLGLVQRDFDESVERDRTLAPDQARDRVGRVVA
jgi:hypothetical protein